MAEFRSYLLGITSERERKMFVRRIFKGFTLIELLVVIAIIALLLSVIAPSLRKAKQATQRIVCASGLRQLTFAMRMYAEDNDGNGPELDNSVWDQFWYQKIAPYFSEDYSDPDQARDGGMATMFCPSGNKSPEVVSPTLDTAGTSKAYWRCQFPYTTPPKFAEGSYGLNIWVASYPYYEEHGHPREDYWPKYVLAPGSTPVFGDSVWVGGWPLPTPPGQLPRDKTPKEGGYNIDDGGYAMPGVGRWCIDRHQMAINLSFVSGEVRKVLLKDLWMLRWQKDWSPRQIDDSELVRKQ